MICVMLTDGWYIILIHNNNSLCFKYITFDEYCYARVDVASVHTKIVALENVS